MPVAINLFGSNERMALALDVDTLEKLPERLGSILALAMNPPTGGFLEKIKTLPKLMEMASFMPKSVNGGMCKDVILKGDQVDLNKFPVLKCWPEDGGRFITFRSSSPTIRRAASGTSARTGCRSTTSVPPPCTSTGTRTARAT